MRCNAATLDGGVERFKADSQVTKAMAHVLSCVSHEQLKVEPAVHMAKRNSLPEERIFVS